MKLKIKILFIYTLILSLISCSNEDVVSIDHTIVDVEILYRDDMWEVYDVSEFNILCIETDKYGNVYIGTEGDGLFINKNDEWHQHTQGEGIISNNVQSIGIDDNGYLYLGDYSLPGISKYNGKSWEIIPMDVSLGGDVHSIAFDKNNTLWAATHEGRILKQESNIWKTFPNQPQLFAHPGKLVFDNAGNLWGPSEWGETFMFDGNDWTLLKVNDKYTRFYCLTIDENNNVWTGNNKGLYQFIDSDVNQFTEGNSELPSNSILSLSTDINNNIFIGTYNNLVKFNGSTWTIFNKNNSPMFDGFVQNISIDNNNEIWFNNDNKVTVYKNQ